MMIRDVQKHFGPPLEADSILAANKHPADNQGIRQYQFKHFEFQVNDRVFKPSKTGQILHEMLYNSDLTNKKVIVMGTGCGVEPVLCAYRGAKQCFACDVHPDSIACAMQNYERNGTPISTTEAHFVVSDLFEQIPANTMADLICFDPPAVKVKFSENPDHIRSSCTGASILQRFFAQIKAKNALHQHGLAHVMISNTADQEQIVHDAYQQGFAVKQCQSYSWDAPYQQVKTLRLAFIQADEPKAMLDNNGH